MASYLNTSVKNGCFGCEACAQVCSKRAIHMVEDEEGFRYPQVDQSLCINCRMCNKVCPYENMPLKSQEEKVAFGGYIKNETVRRESTSGGAFSAIVDTWCDTNYVIFGAVADGVKVYHSYTTDKTDMGRFRKSKYSQSCIGSAYKDARKFLDEEKKVIFSGTPCQISGLKAFLGNTNQDNLLTVEVICEGVPSPHFVRKYDEWMQLKHGSKIKVLDYRYKDGKKWDFQVMYTSLESGHRFKIDRWFNPFWSIWLNHLMSRPACYECPFTTIGRVADISLGDLWGVHLYCPELYGGNGGASLIICNTKKGKRALASAQRELYGHELDFTTALKYQSPMCKAINQNPQREMFMKDLLEMDYKTLCMKWAKKPTFKLLWAKYVWGNRQKVFVWNLKQKLWR
ncbi:Coenzyme F420 hydrogenase/dehydrogenase, beta subunit C-terminal domain [Clostridium sp. MSJ-11]|uniref:Coenzyme F420 hydrogenase/dehydrogenase, beta subunit C-terminal domain n=1 Tax=Clostridium mobile TaxID=2841512 RepID=A0ABS6EKL8_9CLOT|nr:Coenzyme F420 hydrogenase/dehydrogenase, beta subunit C-terminal domain [Clostridium mobile]MBU5485762.1 Coenzyme F420 hydrogenase/dehydrogenase, beta subunit C-terminal domain [Clostridium mobile]